MSGPVDASEDSSLSPMPVRDIDHPTVDIIPARHTTVGTRSVNRMLPRRARRTIGAWCFLDHMTPSAVTEQHPAQIGPHPHMGLQTVTWLVSGQMVHRDSLGVEQTIRPGQLNLMTAGRGVAHAEQSPDDAEYELHGVQLWVAQPEATRHGPPAFEHHAELAQVELGDAAIGTVLVGEFASASSRARRDTGHVGVEVVMRGGPVTLPLESTYEHGVVVLTGALDAAGSHLTPGQLAYLGTGRDELTLSSTEPTTFLLIGGEPFEEELLMWWNYVARSREEVDAACQQWNEHERFGDVDSSLTRIDAPLPTWQRQRP